MNKSRYLQKITKEEGEVADLLHNSGPYVRTTLQATLSTGVPPHVRTVSKYEKKRDFLLKKLFTLFAMALKKS
jgi:hypothetical protein